MASYLGTLVDATAVFAALCSVSFIVVYWRSAKWWRNRVGRSLMIKSMMQSWIFSFLAVARLTATHPETSPYTSWGDVAIFALFGLADLQRSLSFWWEFHVRNREEKGDR